MQPSSVAGVRLTDLSPRCHGLSRRSLPSKTVLRSVAVEFLVLGPLDVMHGDTSIGIAGSKRKALLVLLILRANEVVRTELLIDELWGEQPPRNAAAALQSHVSRLRKALGSEVVARREWGYILRTPPESIDLSRFQRLLVEAHPLPARERAAKLAEALDLWRGPPLADLMLEPGLQEEIARLDELRLSTIERRIDADLEAGRSSELIEELERLIANHPVREHLRWQLILSLYRADRQAEASRSTGRRDGCSRTSSVSSRAPPCASSSVPFFARTHRSRVPDANSPAPILCPSGQ